METLVQTIHLLSFTLIGLGVCCDTKNMVQTIALDEYVLKMPLDVQIGSLGVENDVSSLNVNLMIKCKSHN